jgi:hypothetical protein
MSVASRDALLALLFLGALAPVTARAADQPASSGAGVAIFASTGPQPPLGYKTLASIQGQVCRKPFEPPPTESEALEVLKARAQALGANGIMDLQFDRQAPGPAPRGSTSAPCWQWIKATGTAILVISMR